MLKGTVRRLHVVRAPFSHGNRAYKQTATSLTMRTAPRKLDATKTLGVRTPPVLAAQITLLLANDGFRGSNQRSSRRRRSFKGDTAQSSSSSLLLHPRAALEYLIAASHNSDNVTTTSSTSSGILCGETEQQLRATMKDALKSTENSSGLEPCDTCAAILRCCYATGGSMNNGFVKDLLSTATIENIPTICDAVLCLFDEHCAAVDSAAPSSSSSSLEVAAQQHHQPAHTLIGTALYFLSVALREGGTQAAATRRHYLVGILSRFCRIVVCLAATRRMPTDEARGHIAVAVANLKHFQLEDAVTVMQTLREEIHARASPTVAVVVVDVPPTQDLLLLLEKSLITTSVLCKFLSSCGQASRSFIRRQSDSMVSPDDTVTVAVQRAIRELVDRVDGERQEGTPLGPTSDVAQSLVHASAVLLKLNRPQDVVEIFRNFPPASTRFSSAHPCAVRLPLHWHEVEALTATNRVEESIAALRSLGKSRSSGWVGVPLEVRNAMHDLAEAIGCRSDETRLSEDTRALIVAADAFKNELLSLGSLFEAILRGMSRRLHSLSVTQDEALRVLRSSVLPCLAVMATVDAVVHPSSIDQLLHSIVLCVRDAGVRTDSAATAAEPLLWVRPASSIGIDVVARIGAHFLPRDASWLHMRLYVRLCEAASCATTVAMLPLASSPSSRGARLFCYKTLLDVLGEREAAAMTASGQQQEAVIDDFRSIVKENTSIWATDFTHGTWKCISCGNVNNKKFATCGKCFALRFPSLQCGSCCFVNSPFALDCAACGKKLLLEKANEEEPHGQQQQTDNVLALIPWKCKDCNQNNSLFSSVWCRGCGKATGPLEFLRRPFRDKSSSDNSSKLCQNCNLPSMHNTPFQPFCSKCGTFSHNSVKSIEDGGLAHRWVCGSCSAANPWTQKRCTKCRAHRIGREQQQEWQHEQKAQRKEHINKEQEVPKDAEHQQRDRSSTSPHSSSSSSNIIPCSIKDVTDEQLLLKYVSQLTQICEKIDDRTRLEGELLSVLNHCQTVFTLRTPVGRQGLVLCNRLAKLTGIGAAVGADRYPRSRCDVCLGTHPCGLCVTSTARTCQYCGTRSADSEGLRRYFCPCCLCLREELALGAMEAWECRACKRRNASVEDQCIFCGTIRCCDDESVAEQAEAESTTLVPCYPTKCTYCGMLFLEERCPVCFPHTPVFHSEAKPKVPPESASKQHNIRATHNNSQAQPSRPEKVAERVDENNDNGSATTIAAE